VANSGTPTVYGTLHDGRDVYVVDIYAGTRVSAALTPRSADDLLRTIQPTRRLGQSKQ